MYLKYAALITLLCNSVLSHPPAKEIHDAFSLHPVAINDFYTNPETNKQEQPPTEQHFEETIKEVQELIESNPKLPRLTRGEIIDIIENLTQIDSKVSNTRDEGKRALMVVMPFTAGSAQGDDIKELYTRTPVTHIIGGQASPIKKGQKKNRRRPTLPPVQLPEGEIENLYKVPVQSTTSPSTMLTRITKYLVTDTTSASPTIFSSTKVPKTTTQRVIRSTTFTTNPPPIQFRPKVPQKPMPQKKYPNHRYPEDSNSSEGGIRIISPPQFSPMHYDNQFTAPFTVSLNKLQSVTEYVPSTSTERNIIDDIPIPEDYKHVVKDLNILIDTKDNPYLKPITEKLTTAKELTSQRTYGTTSTKMPDISNVAENLSSDMKNLLMNFGLLNDPNRKPTTPAVSTESLPYKQNADIDPESYISFKPLPDSAPSRTEMEEFLAQFGLGRSSLRSQKSIAMNPQKKEIGKNAEINMDAIPDSMKHVMKDLGFTTNLEKIQSLNQINHHSKHVFNPSTQTANEEELKKLSKLLDMIKDLEKINGNISEENMKDVDVNALRELIGDFNGHKFVPLNEKDAPNPLNESNSNSKQRNGIKRQENSTTTSTTTESATERTDTPSLMELEASFGNQPDVAVVTTTPEPTTTTPRTGFYYLFDWNSFLELDDQLGKRIVLRFQPHAGDPRQFRTITVP
ncbi:hypothetical protein Trydic_g7134 [Trypoxylus dichotomus]